MNDNFQWFTHTPFLSDEQCDELIKQLKEETNWISGYENAVIVNSDNKSDEPKDSSVSENKDKPAVKKNAAPDENNNIIDASEINNETNKNIVSDDKEKDK